MILFTSEFTLGYTSDTKYSPEILDLYKETDIMILNVKNPGKTKDDYNMCTDDAIKFINEVKPKLAIITHFGIKMQGL